MTLESVIVDGKPDTSIAYLEGTIFSEALYLAIFIEWYVNSTMKMKKIPE